MFHSTLRRLAQELLSVQAVNQRKLSGLGGRLIGEKQSKVQHHGKDVERIVPRENAGYRRFDAVSLKV